MGGPAAGTEALSDAIVYYREAACVTDGDHVIVGANPKLAVVAKTSWPSARLVVRGGPNEADIALLEVVKDVEFIASL